MDSGGLRVLLVRAGREPDTPAAEALAQALYPQAFHGNPAATVEKAQTIIRRLNALGFDVRRSGGANE